MAEPHPSDAATLHDLLVEDAIRLAAIDGQETVVDVEAAARTAPSDRLGRYEVTGALGAGGMGEVLQVADPSLGRALALKQIKGDADRSVRRKFLVEAQVTGQLEHPNIVPVHELGRTPDGRLYFTMKRVHGRTLGEALRQPDATLGELLQHFLRICDALAFAHSRGVIHRDLKPDNVMIGQFGEVMVMDWGLAKLVGGPDEGAASVTPDLSLLEALEAGRVDTALRTLDGTIMGTPAYMPPEQAEGRIERLDARADIYALGAILYELLVREPPYDGNAIDVLLSVRLGSPPPPSRRAAVPWELEAVVLRAMARRPDDRYASVRDLQRDVQTFLEGGVLAAARYSRGQRAFKWVRRHRLLTAVALLWVLMLGSLAATQQIQSRRRAAALVRQARARLASAPRVDALDRAADPDGERTADRERREQAIEAHLEAAAALDQALRLRPSDPQILAERIAAGRRLGALAMAGRDYTLARHAFGVLGSLGASAADVEGWLAAVERHRSARVDAQLASIRRILEQLGTGRVPPGLQLADYVVRAVRVPHERVAAQLARVLEDAGRRPPGQRWTRGEQLRLTFACRALGRLAHPAAIEPLIVWLHTAPDEDLALEPALALCRIGGDVATGALVGALDRWGSGSALGAQLKPLFSRLLLAERPGDTIEQLRLRGSLRLQAGDGAGAAADLDRVIRAGGTATDYNSRGHARLLTGDLAGARADLDASIARAPTGSAYVNRAEVRRQAGDLAGAARDLKRSLTLATQPAAVNNLAMLLAQLGRYGDALKCFEALPPAIATQPGMLRQKARVYLRMGRFREAAALLERAIDRAPGLPGLHFDRARARSGMGQLAGALEDLRQCELMEPNNVDIYLERVVIYQRQSQLTLALRAAEQAVEMAPENARAYQRRGFVRFFLKQRAAAFEDFERALALAPEDAHSHYNRGAARRMLGQLDGARTDLERAVVLDPTHWLSHATLGSVLVQQGDRKAGARHYQQAYRLAPPSGRGELAGMLRKLGARVPEVQDR